MALPTNISFGTITGRFIRAVIDGSDGDRDPDGIPLEGLVIRLSPSRQIFKNLTDLLGPVTIVADPIVVVTDSRGILVGPDGLDGIRVVATDDPDLIPTNWTWQVSISGPFLPGAINFSIAVPSDSTIDLTTAVPVPANPGQDVAAWLQVVMQAEAARDQAEQFASQAIGVQDTAVSDLLLMPGSQTRATYDARYARKSELEASRRDISVMDYGAVGDGVTDDTNAFNTAANVARALKLPVEIPQNEFEVKGSVTFYTDIHCRGKIKMDAALSPSIRLARTQSAFTYAYSALGGLTAGSTRITGLEGRTGTLVIISNEILIGRISGGEPFYRKIDSVRVIDTSGTLSLPLESTYGSTFSVTLFPDEAHLTVNDLEIEMRGAGTKSALDIYRSSVTMNSLVITNPAAQPIATAVRVQDASNVTFNDGRISGFSDVSGAGYGVAAFNTSALKFYRCEFTKCRHGITGRHMKDTLVSGGTYEGGIDSHWGNGFVIEDIVGLAPSTANQVLYCGSDLVIRRSRFYGARNIVGIRFDTPELAGNLTLEDVYWEPEATVSPYMIGYSSFTGQAFDFGRTLKTPMYTRLRNIDIRHLTPYSMDLFNLVGNGLPFSREYWNSIDIDNVRFTNVTTGRGILEEKKDSTHLLGGSCSISIKNTVFPSTYSSAAYIIDTEDSGVGTPFSVSIENCENVRTHLPEAATARARYSRSFLNILSIPTPTTRGWRGDYQIENCTLASTSFSGNARYDILDSMFSGSIVSNTISIDARLKSSIGNRIVTGTTGAPTVGREYRNPAFYTSN